MDADGKAERSLLARRRFTIAKITSVQIIVTGDQIWVNLGTGQIGQDVMQPLHTLMLRQFGSR
jgi:hypothetical protein